MWECHLCGDHYQGITKGVVHFCNLSRTPLTSLEKTRLEHYCISYIGWYTTRGWFLRHATARDSLRPRLDAAKLDYDCLTVRQKMHHVSTLLHATPCPAVSHTWQQLLVLLILRFIPILCPAARRLRLLFDQTKRGSYNASNTAMDRCHFC